MGMITRKIWLTENISPNWENHSPDPITRNSDPAGDSPTDNSPQIFFFFDTTHILGEDAYVIHDDIIISINIKYNSNLISKIRLDYSN